MSLQGGRWFGGTQAEDTGGLPCWAHQQLDHTDGLAAVAVLPATSLTLGGWPHCAALQEVVLSKPELCALRAELPALAPSFVQHCNCGRVHPIDEVRVCGGGDALQRSAAEPT